MSTTNILFLDIETVARVEEYGFLNTKWQGLWKKKIKYLLENGLVEDERDGWRRKAAIYAEFGRIVCVSLGVLKKDENLIRIKTISHDDEKVVLEQVSEVVEKSTTNLEIHRLCGHNIKEFDVPYLCRRMLANNMTLPSALDIGGMKNYMIKHLIDTLDMWKFGDYKHYTSLNLMSEVLGIPSSKDDIDGSQVHDVYFKDHALDRIGQYCAKDVLSTMRVYGALIGDRIPEDIAIEYV